MKVTTPDLSSLQTKLIMPKHFLSLQPLFPVIMGIQECLTFGVLSYSLYNVASTFGSDSENTSEMFSLSFVLNVVHQRTIWSGISELFFKWYYSKTTTLNATENI
jgi:hypothetical protein